MNTLFEYWTRSISAGRLQLFFTSLQTLLYRALTTLPLVTIGFVVLDMVASLYWGKLVLQVVTHMQNNPGQPLMISPQQLSVISLVNFLNSLTMLLIIVHVVSLVVGRGYTYWQIFIRIFLFGIFSLIVLSLPIGLLVGTLVSTGVISAAFVPNMYIFWAIGVLLYIASFLGILFFAESEITITAAWNSLKKAFVLVVRELPFVALYSVVIFFLLLALGIRGQAIIPLIEGNAFVFCLQKVSNLSLTTLSLSVAAILYLLAKQEEGLFPDSVDENHSDK